MTPIIDIIETQRKLVACALPSGFERPQARLLRELAAPYCDEVFTDTLGNVLCHKRGEGPRVLFCAHMDVIGFMVNYADARGFLRFEPLGGFTPGMLVGTPVVSEKGVHGAIFADSESGFSEKSLGGTDIHDLYIDIGAADRAEALALCPVGSVFMYDGETRETGNGCMISPYIDDLGGCVALLIGMSRVQKPANDLWFAFTVQEEVGCRGAKTAAYRVNPAVGFAVDVTDTGDSPEFEKHQRMAVKLGKGPAVKVMDGSLLCNPQAVEHLRLAAEAGSIPYTDEVLLFGGTDASSIQRTGEGIPAGGISIPTRAIHSPGEIAKLSDIEAAGRLIAAACERPYTERDYTL